MVSAHHAERAAMSERALLGASILSEHAYRAVSELVDAADMRGPHHADVWLAIAASWANDATVDAVTVSSRCPNVAPEYILGLLVDTPSTSNAARYAEQVADFALRSRLTERAAEITTAAWSTATALDAIGRARELLATIRTPQATEGPDPDLDEFLAEGTAPYDWLVPGFLERGDRLIVTAGEGGGKSTWLRQTALQVACGVHPWNPNAIVPARNVAIIDLENSHRQVVRRLSDMRPIVADRYRPNRLRVAVRPAGIDLTQRADRRWLLERCAANATEMLIIGPTYRLMAGVAAKGDAGGEDQARQVTAALDAVRAELGVTILMEAHSPQASGVSGHRDLRPIGSSVWLRWPEFGIGIRREGGNVYNVDHWRGKRDGDRAFPERLLRGAGPWPWTPDMPTGFRIPPVDDHRATA